MSAVQIVPLSRRWGDVRRFLQAGEVIYRRDPYWVAPLWLDLKRVFSDANPLFEHAEIQLWIATRHGQPCGRIASIIDRNFNLHHKACAAFFGFFECADDAAVSQALFDAVLAWAKAKGMKQMLGPLNPSTNETSGLLVEGFGSDPVCMMPYNPAYYASLITRAGFTKAKDLLAFWFPLVNTPMARFERLAAKFKRREPEIAIVPIQRRNLLECLGKVQAVYNEAWQANWGFVPMTDAEVRFMAERLKPVFKEGLAYVAETAHEPVGFLLALPDFNQVLKPLKGRLLTPRLVKALPYWLGRKIPKLCRVVTLGVKARYRGRGIEAAMLAEGLRTGFRLGFRSVEASWILEDNLPVQRLIELFGGQPYKRYRVYERLL